jgi:murein DD-endopeptidase MepM/ murein hydrolase activator NlpD
MSASTKLPLELGFAVSGEVQEPAGPGPFIRAAEALRRRADAWFPERQILIRGPGNVSALHFSQRAQLLGAAAIICTAVALAATSIGMVLSYRAEARIAQNTAQLQNALTAAQAQAAQAQAAYQAAAAQRDQAVAQAQRARDAAIAQAMQARDAAIAQADRARDAAIAAASQARDAAIARANSVAAGSDAALNGLINQTQSTMGQVESVIKSTGLDPSRFGVLPAAAGASDSSSIGLPVVITPATPLPGAAAPEAAATASLAVPTGLTQDAARRADLLIADLKRLQTLGDVLAQMPLSSPTAQAIVSSGFGFRADPFTGAPEFHVGIDLPGPIGAPVYATAPGTVTFAGVMTGYGNLITIDHGYGFSTRYSHLDKIMVKLGAKVTLHQEIGLMGNTGWSTGPHLLYETRVDGQPQNPLNFIKVNPYDVQN